MGHHGSPLQLPPAPRRLCCLSSIPSRSCCCPSSGSSSSTCGSSSSSSRSLHLSSCCSSCSTCSSSSSASSSSSSSGRKKEETSSRGTCSRSSSRRSSCCPSCSSTCRSSSCCSRLHLSTCSDGSSCVCIFGVSTFQGFHSFLLNCFINKQTRDLCTMQWLQRHYQSYLFQQHFFAAVLCFPSSFKDQESRCELQQYAALSFKFHSFKCQVL